ncbi:hypothetical protein K7711_30735 [Nocardia sp. CA2R105]|uniref:hypothetical protein n=1 Tax=Nocardia coffeae TaxID=2873381 RepID=UPI001CA6E739|nr:hypothetical protein [Nocardia coffeae]MBY8860887.1 hypothetical protein [Nocardia coffeae]
MPEEFTQAAARNQLHRYLVRTLRALPAELSIALRHPQLPRARLHGGVTMPFGDDGREIVSEYFTIGYWVIGTTPDTAGEYFDSVVRSWAEFGWPTRADRSGSRTRAADTRTPDDFQLHIQRSANGYLSLSGSTPPFPVGSVAGDPLPQVIEHPTG